MAVYPTSEFITEIKMKVFVPDKTHHNMYWYYIGGKKHQFAPAQVVWRRDLMTE